jgi:TfoX/Sxy family transcriptional regulator of competence genes
MVDYIIEQREFAGLEYYRKMFGEYDIYCHDKMVALVY